MDMLASPFRIGSRPVIKVNPGREIATCWARRRTWSNDFVLRRSGQWREVPARLGLISASSTEPEVLKRLKAGSADWKTYG
jgi:hypothetical protein